MNTRLLLTAAAGAIALGGVTVSFDARETALAEASSGAPFLHPLLMARSSCGDGGDALAARRAFFIRAASAYARTTEGMNARDDALGDAPGGSSLGAIGYDIATAVPEAQAMFNQGLAFAYGFNHQAAVEAFRRAQAADPACAMCYWGEAFALGPNINAPMFPDAAAPAFAALEKAQALSPGAGEKERGLIDALAARYAAEPPADRAGLDNAFADAMDALARQYPEDDFIAALAAEANMDTQPWNYWDDNGRVPRGRTARTVSLLEGVLARTPDHPAAIHLYIHITEASQNPYRAADHADRLAALAPGLGHLVHMPSHTYYRIGRFKQSLDHNIKAIAADEAFLESSEASILYEYGYYTHNIHFAMTSALMAGDAETALAMAHKLDRKLPIDMAAAAPWVQPIKAAPYYAMATFAAPEAVLDLEDPGDALPFLRGAWRYARGEAFARLGDAQAAMREAEAISELAAEADMNDLTGGGVPALDILNIARLTVIARAAAARRDYAGAVEAMEEAVALQSAIAYTEPPYWYYPAKQTLAAMVLQTGDAERAEQLFIEALAESPNNAWVLHGLSETYKAQNDRSGAKYARALFRDAWLGGKRDAPSLARL